jgi:hypothetical protein
MLDDPRQQSWWQTIPGILTAIAAVLTAVTGLLAVLRSSDEHKATPVAVPAATATQQALTVPHPQLDQIRREVNLSGQWRNNLGAVYQLVQNGNAFRFEGKGPSCTGGYFQSSGSGTVTGISVESTYQSNYPSRGSCSGTLSQDGAQITSTCTDSACGTFVVSMARQQ